MPALVTLSNNPLNQAPSVQLNSSEELWLEKDAARFLKVSVRTLQSWRWRGCGPAFIRVGYRTIRYRLEDLRSFVTSRIKMNTAQG